MGDNQNNQTTVTHSYYAMTEKMADGAVIVTGWFDIPSDGDPANYPDPATLNPISPEDWKRQYTTTPRPTWQIKDGKLATYTAPPFVIPLKDKAAAALQQARTTVRDNYLMLNETVPDVWVTYLKSLMAITDGKDTTSTTLPVAPSDTTT